MPQSTAIKISTRQVTPKMAERWLAKNHPRNRKISSKLVDTFAEDMSAGNWRLTHQGICFDGDGQLIDGQHRLSAVVKSGKTIALVVAVNDGAQINDPIDRSRARSISYLTGYRAPEIAACKVLRSFEDGGNYWRAMTASGVTAVLQRHVDAFQALSELPGRSKITGGILGALVWAYPVIGDERAKEFALGLDPEQSKRGTPSHALRAWLATQNRWPIEVALATATALMRLDTGKDLSNILSDESGYRYFANKRRAKKVANTPDAATARAFQAAKRSG